MNHKIVIVEDELLSARYLKEFLEKEKFEVTHIVDNAADALSVIKEESPDIALLDIMLKGSKTGSELSLEISMYNKNIIIIFISAYSTDEMIEYAIDAGADGYLLKPYREKEIISTIKLAIAKKMNKHSSVSVNVSEVTFGDKFIFNLQTRKLYQYGVQIPLSTKAITLIEVLVMNLGSVVSNEQIMNYIWKSNANFNTLRSLVHRVKVQLNDHVIINSNGFGYIIKV